MSDSLALWFLYRTAVGRMCLKVLAAPAVSRAAGFVLSSGVSARFVPYFIRKNNIDLRDIEIPRGGFASFNDFFSRRRKSALPCPEEDVIISPCDGLLSVLDIHKGQIFDIKHTRFSLADLLEDERLCAKFEGGTALIFRLTPRHYHRYCYAAGGRVLKSRKIGGILHCVRPVATRVTPVYVQNSREYQVLVTKRFGTLVQMEIGALLVGKIRNETRLLDENRVRAGMEKGYFEFGGSTVLLLLGRNAAALRRTLFARKNGDGEIPVRMGEWVAKKD